MRMKSWKPRPMPKSPKTNLHEMSEKELLNRLVLTLMGILFLGALVIGSVFFFGPQIGYIFGLISVNRNQPVSTDKVAPEAPIMYDFPEATKESTASIKGYAEAGSSVKLFVNGPEVQTSLADSSGQFVFNEVQLNEGRNTIFAKAVDQSNNESEKSQSISIEVDTTKPKIEIESPKNDSTIRNLDKSISIKGKVSEKSNITINSKFVVVKPDLTFEFLLGVEEGNLEIKIEATDNAGNKSEEKLKIRYEKRGI